MTLSTMPFTIGIEEELSLPFISSAVENLGFCITTGYLFQHA